MFCGFDLDQLLSQIVEHVQIFFLTAVHARNCSPALKKQGKHKDSTYSLLHPHLQQEIGLIVLLACCQRGAACTDLKAMGIMQKQSFRDCSKCLNPIFMSWDWCYNQKKDESIEEDERM